MLSFTQNKKHSRKSLCNRKNFVTVKVVTIKVHCTNISTIKLLVLKLERIESYIIEFLYIKISEARELQQMCTENVPLSNSVTSQLILSCADYD